MNGTGWNAAVKMNAKPAEIMTAQMVLSAVIGVPGFLWTGLPAEQSWVWIAGSTALNLVTVTALLRAYVEQSGGVPSPAQVQQMRRVAVALWNSLALVMDTETTALVTGDTSAQQQDDEHDEP